MSGPERHGPLLVWGRDLMEPKTIEQAERTARLPFVAGPEEQDGDRYEDEYIQVYGYRLVTEHPLFGEQTSVFAFRNASNGYYGGWMFDAEVPADEIPEILDDVLGD